MSVYHTTIYFELTNKTKQALIKPNNINILAFLSPLH